MKKQFLKGDLKWYYDQKIISFFPSNFESMFAHSHLTGKVLAFEFYPKAVYFECKFGFYSPPLFTFKTDRFRPQRVGSRENDVIYSPA